MDFSDNISQSQKRLAKKVVLTALEELGQPIEVEVCISVVDDKEMQKLNKKQRGVNRVTDVLSFPAMEIKAGEKIGTEELLFGKAYLGDIIICDNQIERQAKEYGVTHSQEFVRMVLHSVLHLLGYDHIKEDDEKVMHAVEYPIYEKLTNIKLS